MDNNPAVSWQYVCMICRRVGRGKKKLHVHSKLVQHGNALRPRLHTLAKLLRGGDSCVHIIPWKWMLKTRLFPNIAIEHFISDHRS